MPAANVNSSTTAEALTLNAPSLTTSAGDYVFDYYTMPVSTNYKAHDEDDYKNTQDVYEDYHYSITIDLTASDAATVSNNGGTITSYEFSYSTDEGANWTVLQDTDSTTFSHRFGQSSGVKWRTGQAYKVGQIVHHGGVEYKVLIAHTSANGPAHSSMSEHFEQTGFKIENFLGIGAGAGAYAPWYRVIAKNSIGYESSPSTIVKYAFIDDTTTDYFTEIEPGSWSAATSTTDIGTTYSHFLYMKHQIAPRQHDSTLSAQYGDGTIVHSLGVGSTNNMAVRWEDPNAPRTLTYSGGANATSGNWNWFYVYDYLNGLASNNVLVDAATGTYQSMQFVKFDIDNS
jgi:hypothetical protein